MTARRIERGERAEVDILEIPYTGKPREKIFLFLFFFAKVYA